MKVGDILRYTGNVRRDPRWYQITRLPSANEWGLSRLIASPDGLVDEPRPGENNSFGTVHPVGLHARAVFSADEGMADIVYYLMTRRLRDERQ